MVASKNAVMMPVDNTIAKPCIAATLLKIKMPIVSNVVKSAVAIATKLTFSISLLLVKKIA